jgi:hypothetical protein
VCVVSIIASNELSSEQWGGRETDLKIILGNVWAMEARYRIGESTVQDLDKERRNLRVARYALDEAFLAAANGFGLDLSPSPGQFRFVVSQDGRGLLLEFPEPIDWTRYSVGPVQEASNESNASTQPAVLYTSDFTRILVVLGTGGGAPEEFKPSQQYRVTIRQFPTVPEHLGWLQGWIEQRRRDFNLVLEIPPASKS